MRNDAEETSDAFVTVHQTVVFGVGAIVAVMFLLWFATLLALSVGAMKWAYAFAMGVPCSH
jgi:hypothetical protein